MFLVARGHTGDTEQGVKNILSGLKWAATYPDNDEKVYIFTDGSYKITSSKDDPETTEGGSSESADPTSSEGSVSGGTSSGASSSSSSSGTSSGSEQDKEIKPGDIIVRTGADSHVIMFLEWTEDGQIRCIHESGGSVNNVSVSVRSANWPYYRRLVSD